jgi:isopentenyl-diphosphate delta-isomerase
MEERKKAHINLAFQSRVDSADADSRFFYEPLLSAHPSVDHMPFEFAGKTMRLPVWVSSMTGGTALAGQINRNLALACADFGMGMGLGSCRVLLDEPKYFPDFDVRHIIGNETPFYANLGIAQLEQMLLNKSTDKIGELVDKLRADGIIIHINPLQEAFQPEGDLLKHPPIETLQRFIEDTSLRVIVKEVGQGMGPKSLKALLKLPLQAIEFGALGGTNFTKLELARHAGTAHSVYNTFGHVGHTAAEMLEMVNNIVTESPDIKCQQLIVSGGIVNVLDGYFLIGKSKLPAIIGMGSAFLEHAMEDYAALKSYAEKIKKSLMLAESFLTIK